MATKGILPLILIVFFVFSIVGSKAKEPSDDLNDDDPLEGDLGDVNTTLNRDSFPPGFIFGTASSAYQYEGAANISGKGQSIWDNFTATYPHKIKDNSSGMVADDTYHRYKVDVGIMKDLGFDAYRFSISWPRILPRGKISGGLNGEGIAYYNYLIDELIFQGIQPFVTIFHFDLPQALQDEYGGFLSETIVNDFRDYAELCFALYGDRVKNWITINEPWSYTTFGYAYGTFPPNRCSKDVNKGNVGLVLGRFSLGFEVQNCTAGNSGTEPYLVTHNLLLSHAAAVKVYREKYQVPQKGQIGITLCSEWFKPKNYSSTKDQYAKDRALAFTYGWYMEPLANGTYPQQMIKHVGDRLPRFNQSQSKLVKGSFDFIGLNYYTANYVADMECSTQKSYLTDSCANVTKTNDGKPIGKKTALDWLYIYPPGIRDLLKYTKRLYNNPVIYVTENGVARRNLGNRTHDRIRKRFHKHHLKFLADLTKNDTVNLKGYFVWSLLDNFEWLDGYTSNFGLVYVDRATLNISYKDSANWFKSFLHPNQTT